MQISGLPVSTAFGAADVLAIEINGVTYKITGATLAAALQSMGDYLTAQDIANNLTTTDEGYVLDARQGKALLDALTALNASDVGAVAVDQGAANAGKALVVGNNGNVTTGETVRPDAAQTLTAAEQAQARGNIGAASATELAAETAAREAADSELKSALDEVYHARTFTTPQTAGWYYMDYEFVAGHKYSVSTNYTSIFSTYTVSSTMQNIDAVPLNIDGTNKRTFIASANATKLKVFNPLSLQIRVIDWDSNFLKMETDVDVLKTAQLNDTYYNSKYFSLSNTLVEHGSITNGDNDGYRQNARIRSISITTYVDDVVIIPDDAEYVIFFYTNGIYDTNTVWLTAPYVIPANKQFRLLMCLDKGSSSDTDVDTILARFVFRTNYRQEIDELKNKTDSLPVVPSYYFADDYLKNKIDAIIDNVKSSANVISYAFITDLHINNNAGHGMSIIKYIADRCPNVPFVICGGDIPSVAGTDLSTVIAQGQKWYEMMSVFGKTKVYQICGNHDYNGTGMIDGQTVTVNATYDQTRQFVVGNIDSFIKVPYCKQYYYIDVPSKAARIIMLDIYEDDRNRPDMHGYIGVSQTQIDWITDIALNVTNTNIIFVTHESCDPTAQYYNVALAPLMAIFKGLKNKTAVSYSSGGITISKDYTNTTNTFVYVQSGHLHKDWDHTDDNVLSVVTNCDALYATGGYTRTVGTISEQSFDIVTIDTDAKKIYCTRIGAGSDRVFDY